MVMICPSRKVLSRMSRCSRLKRVGWTGRQARDRSSLFRIEECINRRARHLRQRQARYSVLMHMNGNTRHLSGWIFLLWKAHLPQERLRDRPFFRITLQIRR